jgi:hypothetical protein
MGLFRKLNMDRWTAGSDEELSSRSQQIITVLAVLGVLVPATLILLTQTVRAELKDTRVRAQLERDGVVTSGTVAKVKSPLRWNVFPATAQIAFVADERGAVTTWVPVSHAPEDHAHLDIRYSRSNPSVARLTGDERPNRGRWKLVAVGGPVFSIALIAAVTVLGRWQPQREGRPSYWTGGAGSRPS